MIGSLASVVDVVGVLQRAGALGERRGAPPALRGGEEDGVDQVEVALILHALHQDGADHAAPTDEADGRSHGLS